MVAKPALVVLAAGMASRYGSPKQLDAIGPNGEGIIDYSVFDAARAGFGKVVFVIKEQSADSFDNAFMQLRRHIDVEYAFQDRLPPPREKPWGTGHALLSAAAQLTEPFAMINADDYYGQSSFASAATFLANTDADSHRYGMLGYALHDTLSPYGSVSRGLCEVDQDNALVSVVEHKKIVADDGEIRSVEEGGESRVLTGAEPTSMNYWLLTPTIFDFLEDGFAAFLEQHADSASAEFILPEYIGELVRQGSVSVSVLQHSDSWFGLTYPEDKERAARMISGLHESGVYPTPLWEGD